MSSPQVTVLTRVDIVLQQHHLVTTEDTIITLQRLQSPLALWERLHRLLGEEDTPCEEDQKDLTRLQLAVVATRKMDLGVIQIITIHHLRRIDPDLHW